MLNPFAIEKELFAKTDALTSMLTLLKGVVATSIVKKQDRRGFSKGIIRECLDVMGDMEAKSKLYVCKVCGKEFDEGRKLGGHVSRAHKGSQSSIYDQDSDTETVHPKRNRTSAAVRRGCGDTELSYLEEEDEEEVSSEPEVYVPRMSRRRARLVSLEEDEETGIKKVKMEVAIFYEDS
jgi:DNA-directed RNA polymerase subunit M/transcription elongation factor TFIIS